MHKDAADIRRALLVETGDGNVCALWLSSWFEERVGTPCGQLIPKTFPSEVVQAVFSPPDYFTSMPDEHLSLSSKT
jgi:hypothetical protein